MKCCTIPVTAVQAQSVGASMRKQWRVMAGPQGRALIGMMDAINALNTYCSK